MTSPTESIVASLSPLTIDNAGFCTPGVPSSSQAWAAPPAPSSTHAVLRYEPASISAWVTVCVAEHVIDAPGANDEPFTGVHVPNVASVSVTVTLANVVLPVLVATIE